MKKVFRTKKFVEDCVKCGATNLLSQFVSRLQSGESTWQTSCDGKTIEECKKMGYIIDDDWCVEE